MFPGRVFSEAGVASVRWHWTGTCTPQDSYPKGRTIMTIEHVASRGEVETIPPGYHRHPNGGGLVADTATVARSAYVDRNSRVDEFATLGPSARLFHHARVSGRARIGSMVTLRDNAHVFGQSVLDAGVIVRERGCVGGASWLRGAVIVEGHARLVDVDLKGAMRIC